MKNILETSKSIWSAMQNEDLQKLKELVHQDALFVHMGVTLSRDEEIDVIKNKGIVYHKIDFKETTIREIESTTILLTKLVMTAIVGGNEVTNRFVVTEIYTDNNNKIKLASMSYTKINYE